MRPRVILTVDDSPTIRRVVQLSLAPQGYEVHAAADGEEGLRLAEELRPDLILVDLVMPGMSGEKLCRALAGRAAVRDTPVIVLSARADQRDEPWSGISSIVGHLGKPFSPAALLAAVEQALRGGGADHTPVELLDESTDSHPLVVLETEVTGTGTLPVVAAADPGPSAALPSDDEVREAIAQAVGGDDAASAHIAEEVRVRLTPRTMARLTARLAAQLMDGPHRRLAGPLPPPALSGDLGRVPFGDVLALLGEQGQDGVLEARAESLAVQVCLRGGRVDFVGADGLGEEHRLGSHLVRARAIGRADLELFFGSRAKTARLCGEQLVKLGQVRAEELRAALRRQSAERLYEALRMARGRFELRALVPDEPLGLRAADAALGLSVPALLLEGGRRIEEWHLLRREIGDDEEAVFLRNEEAAAALPQGALLRDEQAVLDLCDARSSVRDIVRQTRLGSYEVALVLLRLRTARLIRRRVRPVAV